MQSAHPCFCLGAGILAAGSPRVGLGRRSPCQLSLVLSEAALGVPGAQLSDGSSEVSSAWLPGPGILCLGPQHSGSHFLVPLLLRLEVTTTVAESAFSSSGVPG